MNWKIGNVDERSTVQVGSFRIDSSGNQQLREVRTFSFCTVEFHICLIKAFMSLPYDLA